MKAIITVNARDNIGSMAALSSLLAACNVNILDISQTIMGEYFVMIMLVDYSRCQFAFDELRNKLTELGSQRQMNIRIQREDIFEAMYRV
ncbi:MAG TPA: ACT domain-containing protein [Eubacteriales bacterium]|jgi:ACT domain-containing protein|nr:ACT domain-containing protein [Clostridia bacterium]HRV73580.1 ACT domain-containing protein [Eubacteriales bacterium]